MKKKRQKKIDLEFNEFIINREKNHEEYLSEEIKLENTLDLKEIDQLHNSVLNFSKASIQIKGMLISLAAILAPILINLANNKLDYSLFVGMYLIIVVFWILDAFTYYYQEKLRFKMRNGFNAIRERSGLDCSKGKNKSYIISREEKQGQFCKVFHAFINLSQVFYYLLVLLNTLALCLFIFGLIK